MDLRLENHPCFNDKARHTFGRVHLPVAPRCNIQCNFCNRKFDCVNESRPGVSSGILKPAQAMAYLEEVFSQKKNISVVGIAGPGDPFANADETLETMRLVREKYPDMMLCVASNGLNVLPYLDDIAALTVSHFTVTVNAVDPEIAAKIYSWVRFEKRVRGPREGAEILLARQEETIRGLKARGITTKVNTIVIPGVNDHHVEEVAKWVGALGVDILNILPYYPNEGSNFAHLGEPPKAQILELRNKAKQYVPLMHHCTRCRADAVGLLGESMSDQLLNKLKECETMVPAENTDRPYVAVASGDGAFVNEHLGQARRLLIYGRKNGKVAFLEARSTPKPGVGNDRWDRLADQLGDCRALLVSGIGNNPRTALSRRGITITETQGSVAEKVGAIYDVKEHPSGAPESTCSGPCSA
ncbi:MAG: radical SAM protein [Desulfovibrionales bacterium]